LSNELFAKVANLHGPEHEEVAALLLGKATDDLNPAKALASDPVQADHVIGFHAQQAAEKAIKAVLADRAIEIPGTHDLTYLVSLVPWDVPAEIAELGWLTPWSVAWRYDNPAHGLDRAKALASATSALDWAQDTLARST
jgi:HEPN domain-containing protein